MEIKKVKIESYYGWFGLSPHPEKEVEQRLTITSNGQIWFSAFKYGNGFDKYPLCRKKQIKIGQDTTTKIFTLFSYYIESNPQELLATDIGRWKMTIFDTDGKEYDFVGALFGGVKVGEIDLTNYLREQIPIQDLMIFDSCDELNDEE